MRRGNTVATMEARARVARSWTVGELAARLGMHRNSVRWMIHTGLIEATRTAGGHFRIEHRVVERLLGVTIAVRAERAAVPRERERIHCACCERRSA